MSSTKLYENLKQDKWYSKRHNTKDMARVTYMRTWQSDKQDKHNIYAQRVTYQRDIWRIMKHNNNTRTDYNTKIQKNTQGYMGTMKATNYEYTKARKGCAQKGAEDRGSSWGRNQEVDTRSRRNPPETDPKLPGPPQPAPRRAMTSPVESSPWKPGGRESTRGGEGSECLPAVSWGAESFGTTCRHWYLTKIERRLQNSSWHVDDQSDFRTSVVWEQVPHDMTSRNPNVTLRVIWDAEHEFNVRSTDYSWRPPKSTTKVVGSKYRQDQNVQLSLSRIYPPWLLSNKAQFMFYFCSLKL